MPPISKSLITLTCVCSPSDLISSHPLTYYRHSVGQAWLKLSVSCGGYFPLNGLIMHLINSSIRITTALTSGKLVIVFQDTKHLELFHLPSQYHIRLLPLHRQVSVDFQHSFYDQLAARLPLKTSPSHDLLSFLGHLTTNLISRYSEQA